MIWRCESHDGLSPTTEYSISRSWKNQAEDWLLAELLQQTSPS